MKMIVSILMAIMLVANPISIGRISCWNETEQYRNLQTERYIASYLSSFDQNAEDIILSDPLPLRNALTDEVIAICYTINHKGYVILNLSDYSINEYDLLNAHPIYNNSLNTYYYGGLFLYFYEDNSQLVDAYSQKPVSRDFLVDVYQAYENDYPVLSQSDLTTKIKKCIDYAASASRRENLTRSTISNQLSQTYSTVFVNYQCGATACATLIDFCAKRDNDYRIKGGLTQIELIQDLIPRVTPTYGTDDLADGVNEFIDEINENYPNNPIQLQMMCQYFYQFGTVRDCIDQDIPITVGGEAAMIDGVTDPTSHVVAVWGYSFTIDPIHDIYFYLLRVNNGWGSNSATVSYFNTPPSTLADHVLID